MILSTDNWLTIASLVLNVALVPLLLAYRRMRLDVTETAMLVKQINKSLERVEQRQYDRRTRAEIVDDERREGIADRRLI